MQQHALEGNAVLSVEELRSLAACTGPCVSIYLPEAISRIDRKDVLIRLKAAVQQAEEALEDQGVPRAERAALLEPFSAFSEDRVNLAGSRTLALFRCPEMFRSYQIPWVIDESAIVGSHFHIAPLLPLLQKHKQFYILALSQKHVRVLRCTVDGPEDVELPPAFPKSYEEAMAFDKPDHVLDNRVTSGPSMGSSKGVMFGTGSEEERKDEYLWHFYKQVDRGLVALLKNNPAPVVLAGVDYQLALYQKLSKDTNLLPDGVRASADGLEDRELHRRALEIVNSQRIQATESALQQYEQLGGTNKVAKDAANIMKAAREGRVAHLFLLAEIEYTESHNVAALQTILHSGLIHLVERERMPGEGSMAAVLRY
jgi:hypothetical protein